MEFCSLIVGCCLLAQAEPATASKAGPARSAKSRVAAPAEALDAGDDPADGNGADTENSASEPEGDAAATDAESEGAATATDRGSEATSEAAPADDGGGETALVPVTSPPIKPLAAEALIRELALPSESPLPGKPVSLVEALSRSPDRRRQIEITHAYWNLSATVADHEICVIELSRLEQLLPQLAGGQRPPADLELEAQLAAAHARQRELELNVVTAQYTLAELTGSTLIEVIPADVPHTGAYLTRAQEIYGARPAPPRVHLIDRALPLRLRSLGLRAMAVHAAVDSADSAEQAYHSQQHGQAEGGELSLALTAVAELARQQRAFVAAVRDYNHDIAEYSLGIAPAGMSAVNLVPLLIGPAGASPTRTRPGGGTQVAEEPGGVNRAGFDAVPDAISRQNAPRRNEPTLAPAKKTGAEDGAKQDRRRSPRRNQGPPKRSAVDSSESRREVRKPLTDEVAGGNDGEAAIGIYSALAGLPPKQRTQQLASMLHWDRALPDSLGVASDLDDCLARAPGTDRRALIKTYWLTRERVARYQLMAERIEQFDSLGNAALRAKSEPGGAAAMLRWQRSHLAAHADLETARVELLVSQFALALAGRWPLDGPWPIPRTAPHGGSYRLGLDAQRGEFSGALALRRLAARIPALHGMLIDRSGSIVAIDAARASAASRYEAGETAIDEPLSAIDRQAAETSAFLASQTEYNQEIADYAFSVLPAGTPDARLVEALVLTQ